MLSAVEVRALDGTLLMLPLGDPVGGFFIENVDGLMPGKPSGREPRNIVLTVGYRLGFGESAQSLRWRLFGFLMPTNQVTLRFHMTTGLVVEIDGKVESFEGDQFTQDPTAVISVLCEWPDTDFVNPTWVELNGFTATDNGPDKLVPYSGNVKTGVVFTLEVDKPMARLELLHRNYLNEIRTMEFEYPLVAGDVLTISTIPGDKRATLLRYGSDIPILNGIPPFTTWFQLDPGAVNYYTVFAENAVGVPYNLRFQDRYGGL